MRRRSGTGVAAGVGLGLALALTLSAHPAEAQQAAPAAPKVGDVAPDFSGRGATRYGRVADPIRLSDYKGETIVLAFFYRARSSG